MKKLSICEVLGALAAATLISLALVGAASAQAGTSFRVYAGGPQKAGESASIEVSGAPRLAAAAPAFSSSAPQPAQASPSAKTVPSSASVSLGSVRELSTTALAVATENAGLGLWLTLLGMVVILASVACWLIRRRAERLAADPLRRTCALVAAVADLDEDHERGKIGEQEYVERRTQLADALRAWISGSDLEEKTGAEGAGSAAG